MKRPIAFASVPLAGLAGCGSTTTHHVLTGAPFAPYEVQVILEGSPAPPNIQEVAIVQAVGKGMNADLEHIVEGLKREAQALGCDVVVRVHVDQGSSTASGVAAKLSQ
jgi:hypothetical protein